MFGYLRTSPAAKDNFQVNLKKLLLIFGVNLCSPFGFLVVCLIVTIDACNIWRRLSVMKVSRSTQRGDWDQNEVPKCECWGRDLLGLETIGRHLLARFASLCACFARPSPQYWPRVLGSGSLVPAHPCLPGRALLTVSCGATIERQIQNSRLKY